MKCLRYLASISYELGLIGIDEYEERLEIAQWLFSEDTNVADPRAATGEDRHFEAESQNDPAEHELKAIVKDDPKDQVWLEFLFDHKWVFTISDPDHYPSVPHGHWSSQNQKWPKLNPYTGRVFKKKHQEDPALRLSKSKMQLLWRNPKFRSFCRDHILWHMEEHAFKFSVRRPLRLPVW
jgi:glutathione S-transferase